MKTKLKNNQHIFSQITDGKFVEDIVDEVTQDFKNRQKERKNFEKQWQLNVNFLIGNQYCSIDKMGEIEDYSKQYFWQEREVFNHIAPIMEARMSKLSRIRPKMVVIPATNSEEDIATAKISKNIISSLNHKHRISEKISRATTWSEICGTSFYKIAWKRNGGNIVGKSADGVDIYEGDIDISVCPPFEIYPDNNSSSSLDECRSIIHAKAYDVAEIKNIWGVDVDGEDINMISLENSTNIGGLGYIASSTKISNDVKKNHAIVVERYEMPTVEYPNGRLITVAGKKLLNIEELPYINGADGKRGFPFVMQVSLKVPATFWGMSIIERLIPIQRTFNAVKNRKHEFMNRLSLGILMVEDGSLDTDNLEEEGLSPGKVLIYRQGSTPPKIMDAGSLSSDFEKEETQLLDEFVQISGMSDLLINNQLKLSNLSGTALELIYEQDSNRLSAIADQIKFATKLVAQHGLRLYKQFANGFRISKLVDDNNSIEMFYWKASDISSDDILFETEAEMGETIAQKRALVFELLRNGLLFDEKGKLSNRVKNKTLELLGFGVWDTQFDLNELHSKKAGKENLKMIRNEKTTVLEIDNHSLHIDEHIAFMLGTEYENAIANDHDLETRFLKHIQAHKDFTVQKIKEDYSKQEQEELIELLENDEK